jgi:hypothetical protein
VPGLGGPISVVPSPFAAAASISAFLAWSYSARVICSTGFLIGAVSLKSMSILLESIWASASGLNSRDWSNKSSSSPPPYAGAPGAFPPRNS